VCEYFSTPKLGIAEPNFKIPRPAARLEIWSDETYRKPGLPSLSAHLAAPVESFAEGFSRESLERIGEHWRPPRHGAGNFDG
jgi:hypothetical protein